MVGGNDRDSEILRVLHRTIAERAGTVDVKNIRLEFLEVLRECLVSWKGDSITLLKRQRYRRHAVNRYGGFVEKLMFLLELGVIGSKPVPYQGREIVPLDLFHELIYPIIKFDEGAGDRDITVLLVRVSGKSGELDVDVTYDMVDEYDEENKVTSMAKTTGYTAAIIARILGSGAVKEKGIQWPVRIIRGALFERLLSSLRERGVEITETITKTRGV